MTDFTPTYSIPESYTLRETSDILDQAKRLLAPTLPGCVMRRFDYPIFDGWSHIELCFADQGPIVPKLILSPDSYYCIAISVFGYSSMLRETMNVGAEFRGPSLAGGERLDKGPEAIAVAIQKGLSKFDLAAAVAGGTADRIWADQPRNQDPSQLLELSLLGIYLGKYLEAQELLHDCITLAAQYDQPGFAQVSEKAGPYLSKVTADGEALRATLIATMNDHWSHFKVVDPPIRK
jgi:hypothetical protein